MKLKEIQITGLFGKQEASSYKFHDDINILTGKNGSGKTTIMKLAWLIMSGNISLALKEIDFSQCIIITDIYTCSINRIRRNTCRIKLIINEKEYSFEDDYEDNDDYDDDDSGFFFTEQTAEEKAKPYLTKSGSSLFFPTFRRIEGGFSLTSSENHLPRSIKRAVSDFDEALTNLSKKLSSNEHFFISAISSKDINNLLLRKYADYSEKINLYQQEVSANVIKKIIAFENKENTTNSGTSANQLLSQTREEIEKIEAFRSTTLQPFDEVSKLVEELFSHSGISFGKRLSFGNAADAIYSESLSAGEKQMLSFICYNAFHSNTIIFIDEPELSLHVDWQRKLSSILQRQNPTNQFIFATHSPFIYAKYPDKEIITNSDKGSPEE